MTDASVYVIALGLSMTPPIVALVAMSGSGRNWALTRLVSYSVTAVLYVWNGLWLVDLGVHGAAVGVSGYIAFLAGRGAWRAWRAWRVGDYRPQSARAREAKGAYNAKRL